MLIRVQRALRDQRRYSPTVTVQNAGQVNIGQQQVNVAMRETDITDDNASLAPGLQQP